MVEGRKLVIVEWVDSHIGRGWRDIEDVKGSCALLFCRSVGWLMAENKKAVIIVPHLSGERNGNIVLQGLGDVTIPRKAIIRMYEMVDPTPPEVVDRGSDGSNS